MFHYGMEFNVYVVFFKIQNLNFEIFTKKSSISISIFRFRFRFPFPIWTFNLPDILILSNICYLCLIYLY